LLSIGVEVVQIWVPGRYSSANDVIFNSLGALVGGALAHSSSVLLTPPPRLARRLAVGAALVATTVVAATAVLLQPSFPFTMYFGGWTHKFGHLEWYRGRLLDASIGGLAIPASAISYSGEVRRRLLAEAPLHLSLLAGPPPPGLAPLLSLHDENSVEVLL